MQADVCAVEIANGLQLTLTLVTVTGTAVTVTLAVPNFVGSCVDVAVIVNVPTPEGVNTPEGVIAPLDAVKVTTELNAPVPMTVTVKVACCAVVIDVEAGDSVTEVIVGGTAVTVTFAEPDFVGSCVDVAVQTNVPTPEGVPTPVLWLIDPPVADQFTVCAGLPVPFTIALHVTVCPIQMFVAEGVTVMEVTMGFDPLAEPAPPLLPQLEQPNATVERISSWQMCDERKLDIIPSVPGRIWMMKQESGAERIEALRTLKL